MKTWNTLPPSHPNPPSRGLLEEAGLVQTAPARMHESIQIANDLSRNAIRLMADAKVHPLLMVNALLLRATDLVAWLSMESDDAAKAMALFCNNFGSNFATLVAERRKELEAEFAKKEGRNEG